MTTQARPKPAQPCPCGSGKKYKECCAREDEARRRLWRRTRSLLIGTGAIAVVAAAIYGLSLTAGVPYSDRDIGVVDFSTLNSKEKRGALEAANQARCTCGCGMTLAQCVATDSTCPVRTGNIDKIKTMVERARQSS